MVGNVRSLSYNKKKYIYITCISLTLIPTRTRMKLIKVYGFDDFGPKFASGSQEFA